MHVADVHRRRRPREHRDQDQQLHVRNDSSTDCRRWPDDERRAREADHEADQRAPVDRVRAPAARREQRDPQRRRRIEDRGLVGRDVLHGHVRAGRSRSRTLPTATTNMCRHSVASSSNFRPSEQRDEPQQDPREDEADAAEQERRHRVHADARDQVGRAPDEIDGGEADDELRAMRGFGEHGAGWGKRGVCLRRACYPRCRPLALGCVTRG